MDLAKLLNEKTDTLLALRPKSQIGLVIRHLNTAELHFRNGRKTDNAELFTDVVYRLNQAFEGALKELYETLAKKPAGKSKLVEIENYLLEKVDLKPRLKESITNYRQQWRNPSTHDHKLDFDEYEALAGITLIFTLCYVSIDQISSSLVATATKAPKRKSNANDAQALATQIISSLNKTYTKFLASFGGNIKQQYRVLESYSQQVLSDTFSNFEIMADPIPNTENYSFRPDLLMSSPNGKRFIIEVKSISPNNKHVQLHRKITMVRLSQALQVYDADFAVGLFLPSEFESDKGLVFTYLMSKDEKLVTIIPEQYSNTIKGVQETGKS